MSQEREQEEEEGGRGEADSKMKSTEGRNGKDLLYRLLLCLILLEC